MTIFEQVAEFHKAFSLPLFDTFTQPDQQLQSLRIALLKEEHDELKQAFNDKNLVEIADALGDMAYIICGTMHSYGLTVDAGWEPPFHLPENAKLQIPNEFQFRLDLIENLMNVYLRVESQYNFQGVRDCLCAILSEIDIASHMCGIPFKVIYDEIHRSNMAKLMPDGSVKRRADGKVQKPDGWTPPNIASILYG